MSKMTVSNETYRKKLSIVVVVLNDPEQLKETLLNIQKVDSEYLECLLIDGGSQDETLQVVEEFKDQISKIVSEPDDGIYDAMNKGIQVAKGEYINFMNAGDCFAEKNTMEKVLPYLDGKKDVVYGDSIADYGEFKVYKKSSSIDHLWKGMVFCHQSAFVKTDLMKKNLFDLRYLIGADYDFFCKLKSQNKTFLQLTYPIALYTASGMSNQNILTITREQLKISGNYSAFKSKRLLQFVYAYGLIGALSFFRRILPMKLYRTFVRLMGKGANKVGR